MADVENKYAKTIEGMVLYVSIQEPVNAYQKPGTDPKPPEFKLSLVLTDEDYVDDLEDWATKLDCKLSLKKVKAAEFEGIYKVAPPSDAGKNVWVWTLRKSTELGKTGKPLPQQYRPKVYQKKGNTLVDITNEHLIGNGSTGIVSTELFVRNNGSASIYLKNLLVTNLIKYEKSESDGASYQPGSEFGDVVEGSEEVPKGKSNKKPDANAEELEDSPF